MRCWRSENLNSCRDKDRCLSRLEIRATETACWMDSLAAAPLEVCVCPTKKSSVVFVVLAAFPVGEKQKRVLVSSYNNHRQRLCEIVVCLLVEAC